MSERRLNEDVDVFAAVLRRFVDCQPPVLHRRVACADLHALYDASRWSEHPRYAAAHATQDLLDDVRHCRALGNETRRSVYRGGLPPVVGA